jgi:hypothetical protein
VNFLNILKKCEPVVSQIARDAGVSRQAVYLWTSGGLPMRSVFDKLLAMDKYKEELLKIDYEAARNAKPLGYPKGRANQRA